MDRCPRPGDRFCRNGLALGWRVGWWARSRMSLTSPRCSVSILAGDIRSRWAGDRLFYAPEFCSALSSTRYMNAPWEPSAPNMAITTGVAFFGMSKTSTLVTF